MPFYVLIFLRVLSFLVGFSIVFYVLISVIRMFVLPRSAPDKLVRLVFIVMRKIFDLRISIEQEYERRDEINRTINYPDFRQRLSIELKKIHKNGEFIDHIALRTFLNTPEDFSTKLSKFD